MGGWAKNNSVTEGKYTDPTMTPTIVTHVSLKPDSRRNLDAFIILGINADSYEVIMWVTYQFFGPLIIW
jgi:hypothetical protein